MRNILLLSIAFIFYGFLAAAQNKSQREIDAFIAKTGAIATTDKATNSLNYLRFPIGAPLIIDGNSPEQKAQAFIAQYAGLFGKRTDKDSYLVKETKRDNYGLDHVVLQQYYDRVPVFDGVLKFHFNRDGNLTSLNGNVIAAEKLNATPVISKEDAEQTAIKQVTGQKLGKFAAPLKVAKSNLYVFQKGLAQGYLGALHLVYEIEVRNDADVREFLYIDAHTKELVEQFTGMHSIDRSLYETSVTPANLKWKESNGTAGPEFAALDQWQKSEIESAGHIYNLMKNAFGHDSYDDAGATMVTINNNPNVGCPNANWNGVTANYCTGVASDDVVAHEWAHAYTEYTSGLIYQWQTGALNESYSDIWGETVDQLNAYMDNGESQALRTNCGSSARWQLGEQASAFGGAIRDMWDPTCKGNPGKVSDPQYWCKTTDQGGVHINSGIMNHAYALLVDGGTYNGRLIAGLGLTKTAHLFWHAQAMHMTSTTDFAAQADILEASLIELIGIDLPKLSTGVAPPGLSGIKFTAIDMEQLGWVLSAVEMRMENGCGFEALFTPAETLCKGAEPGNAIFYENFENGLGAWTVSNTGSSPTWTPRDWVLDNTPPGGRNGKVVYGRDFDGGDCFTDFQNGLISFTSPVITIPVTEIGPLAMAFDHYVSMERGWDGGNISYKIGGGAWQLIPKSAFISNGYNTNSFFLKQGNNNPLIGQPGFSGGNQGSLTSDWGQSRIDLSALGLSAGMSIQLRWDLGTDGCGGWDGWYIDDVRVYSCSIPSVQFVSANSVINEAEANTPGTAPNACLKYIEKHITIKINRAPSKPVTVTFNAPTGTATQGGTVDYIITPGSFILQSGMLSQNVIVRIYNDAYVEGNESVKLSYSLSSPPGGNATYESFNQIHTLTILDDDVEPGEEEVNVVSADFNNNLLPAGWQVIGGGEYPDTWDVREWNDVKLDPNGPPLLVISSWDKGPGEMDKSVETSSFNSVGMTSINISFLEFFEVWNEQAILDVWDGTQWRNLLTQDVNTGSSGSWEIPNVRNISVPLAYSNPQMKMRFRYIGDYDYWWLIDNVKVTGTYNNHVQSQISMSPDAQYLGPNATVYFHDPTSGDLIAKIKNLSAHDYGCTSVQVDRAGANETAWFGNHKITNKTFKVTPTNNNPNGNYEITLYYKASELANFNGAAIKSMGKSEGGIAGGTLANSSTSSVQKASFNSDFAYTATFNTGFSGFGLSDAPADGALPVTLSKFEGKHSDAGNVLSWETSAEVNNDYFVVERSRDARKFEEIARITGVGTSAISNSYSFTDAHFETGLNYYRLKQVDKDGSFAYSRMISLEALNKNELRFFPNPVQSLLTVQLPDREMKQGNVKIINSAGQIVLIKPKVKPENGTMSLDVSKLPTGVYEVVISDGGSVYNFSIVKAP